MITRNLYPNDRVHIFNHIVVLCSLVGLRIDIFLDLIHLVIEGIPPVFTDRTRAARVHAFLGPVAGSTRIVVQPVGVFGVTCGLNESV